MNILCQVIGILEPKNCKVCQGVLTVSEGQGHKMMFFEVNGPFSEKFRNSIPKEFMTPIHVLCSNFTEIVPPGTA